MKPFPIPVIPLGPGSQHEDEHLDYLPLPKEMHTYQAPNVPEPEQVANRPEIKRVLDAVLAGLQRASQGQGAGVVSLAALEAQDLQQINQLLGEGESSLIVSEPEDGVELRAQEAIFTGVWRVQAWRGGRLQSDAIEVAPIPHGLLQAAAQDGARGHLPWAGALPPNVQNAPMLVQEVLEQVQRWQPGQPAYVINLSLLPVTPEDIAFLDHQIGTGRVLMLSRGYGNCRISSTHLPNCWRVIYYNSMEKVLLNTVEVVRVPEVALAAPEDMAESHERLLDIAQYLELV